MLRLTVARHRRWLGVLAVTARRGRLCGQERVLRRTSFGARRTTPSTRGVRARRRPYKSLLDQYPSTPTPRSEAEARAVLLPGRAVPEAIAAFGDFERMHPTSRESRRGRVPSRHVVSRRAARAIAIASRYTNALTTSQHRRSLPAESVGGEANLRVRECRRPSRTRDQVATYYLRHRNLKAAEARLSGLLSNPETDATAQALHAFAEGDEDRRSRGGHFALATGRYHPGRSAGADARSTGLGAPTSTGRSTTAPGGRIEEMRLQADRQRVPHGLGLSRGGHGVAATESRHCPHSAPDS